ncbi:MAG: single-stranded DNA-binding protein [Microcoleus sp.]
MNSFIAIVKLAHLGEMHHTASDQAAAIKVQLELLAKYGDHQPFSIDGIAWGKAAEKVATFPQGAVLLVSGQINMIKTEKDGVKGTIASLKISEVVTELPSLTPFNQVAILGNAGQDCESHYFESGNNKSAFTLAVRRSKEETDWFAIQVWGKLAEIAGQYVAKGTRVGVIGHLNLETWTDRATGELRSKPVVVGDRIELAGKKQDDRSSDQGSPDRVKAPSRSYPAQSHQRQVRAPSQSAASVADFADFTDIPF